MRGKYLTYLVTLLFFLLSSGCATFDPLPDDPNEGAYDWSLLNPAIAPAHVEPLLVEPTRNERARAPAASTRNAVRETTAPELGVRLGMVREEVLEVWGEPVAVRRNAPNFGGEYSPESVDERWIYRATPHQPAGLPQTGIVYFQSGRVVGWKIR